MNVRLFGAWVALWAVGCGSPPESQSGAAKPKPAASMPVVPVAAEPPLTELRTGAVTPEREARPLELEPVARFVGPEFETLTFRFSKQQRVRLDSLDVIDIPGATLAFVGDDLGRDPVLWVRRPSAQAATPVSGTLYANSDFGPGVRFELLAKSGANPATVPTLESDWMRALARSGRGDYFALDAFSLFMNRRLLAMAEKKQPNARARASDPRFQEPTGELYQLMETTTGRSAVQQALQHGNTLAVQLAREPKKLPLSAATPPALPRADYAAMLAALGGTPPVERLAAVAPADFWFLRAKTFSAFLDLLELSESWGQPAADMLAGNSEDRGTTARYTAEVALERTELARVLGPSVIESVAVVGSDPYVHDGTDVTFLFEVKAPPLFEASLQKALNLHAGAHGGVTRSEFVHEGVKVRVARSADGRVRQHRANVAGLELVSNSPGAIRRVISSALGKAPRLADEKDFQYLTARDAGTPDEVLGFLSDRFVLSVVGPAQKIAQARRQLALGELTTPGFAALLYGFTRGRSPKDAGELVKSGELAANELRHGDGTPIRFQPGKPAESRWGTASELEPLIDLPPVDKISAGEQRAYSIFASQYAGLWSEYVDPVIVRFARADGAGKRFDMALRALPLLRAGNRDLIQMVGNAAIDVPPLHAGMRWALALGKDAEIRRVLDGRSLFGSQPLKLDWLGDSVMIGVADRSELTNAARDFVGRKLEVPREADERRDELDAIADLPLYAAVEVKNRVGAVVALGVLRKFAEDVVRDMVKWQDGGKHRDVPITDIAIVPSGMLRGGAHVYYALCPKALIFSLNRSVLERLIDDELDGKAPRGKPDARRAELGQFVVELGANKDGALLRTIGWLAAAELVSRMETGRQSAEAVLRGAPESRASADAFRTYARAYLGEVPLTPDGNLYEFSTEGIRDPVRGTRYAPVYPPTPVAGSPLATVLSRFARVRTNISFDTEPGMSQERDTRSFSAKMSLELR